MFGCYCSFIGKGFLISRSQEKGKSRKQEQFKAHTNCYFLVAVGHFPSEDILKGFVSLEKMNLEGVGLTGEIPKYLSSCCPNLRWVSLKSNPELGGRDGISSIKEARASTQHPDDSSKLMSTIEFVLE